MRRRSLSSSSSLHCSNGLARSRSLGAGGGDDVRPVVTVVRAGFRIVGQPVAARRARSIGFRSTSSTSSSAPNTSSNTRLNMARSLRSTTRVARASQNSSSTRWGGCGQRAAKRRSSPRSPRLLRRVGVRRTAPRSRRDRRSLRSPAAGPCLPRSLALLARTDDGHSRLAHDPGESRWPPAQVLAVLEDRAHRLLGCIGAQRVDAEHLVGDPGDRRRCRSFCTSSVRSRPTASPTCSTSAVRAVGTRRRTMRPPFATVGSRSSGTAAALGASWRSRSVRRRDDDRRTLGFDRAQLAGIVTADSARSSNRTPRTRRRRGRSRRSAAPPDVDPGGWLGGDR